MFFFPRAGDEEALTVPLRVSPDVQRGPEPAELLLEERGSRQGNRAVAPQEPLLLGAQGQVRWLFLGTAPFPTWGIQTFTAVKDLFFFFFPCQIDLLRGVWV